MLKGIKTKKVKEVLSSASTEADTGGIPYSMTETDK